MAIRPAQLEWAWLGSVEFKPDFAFDSADTGQTSYTVEPRFAIGDLETGDDDSLAAAVTLGAAITFSRLDDQEGPLPFSLELEVHGVFRWGPGEKPSTDELARGWLEYNGMYLLWPYLRTYVSTLTGLSHLPALTIYTMNVPNPPVIRTPEDASDKDDAARREISADAAPGEPKA